MELVRELERKRTGSIANADIILPAAFGGIERGEGLLDTMAPRWAEPGSETATPDSLKSPDVADIFGRCRLLRILGDDTESETPLVEALTIDGAGLVRFVVDLPPNEDVCRQLISLVPRRERPGFGTAKQPLSCHVGLVEKHARNIAQGLDLPTEIRQAVGLAAAWHDRGKDRDIWQRAAGRKRGEDPLGKSGGSMRPIPGGYRHEFGSLSEFMDAHEGKIAGDVSDLVMHLIAAHHGRGRPHFPKGGYDPRARAASPGIADEVVRRFARLQRKYGYWRLAWLENLLRCADAMASAEKKGGEK
jgi:CRISPR-associated endonuclease/helicase Cas3